MRGDIIFLIENTASNGVYLNDIKNHYIIPTLEYFGHGVVTDENCEPRAGILMGLVLYKTAQVGTDTTCQTMGPFHSGQQILKSIDEF